MLVLIGSATEAGTVLRASAVTAELAKACAERLAKAFPPREPGNPAAGSSAGTAEDQRRYFAKCVASGGRMEDSDKGGTK
jgi:hypothetical protein